MSRLLIALGLFFQTIILIICTVVVADKDITDDKDAKTCSKRNKGTKSIIGTTCYIWKNNICIKGKYIDTRGNCEHKGNTAVSILLSLVGISFIACLVFLVMSFFGTKKKK